MPDYLPTVLPLIKNFLPSLTASDIPGMSAEELADGLRDLFRDFEKMTGCRVVVPGIENSPLMGGEKKDET